MSGPVFCLHLEISFVFLTIWEMKLTDRRLSSIMLQSERMSDQAQTAPGPLSEEGFVYVFKRRGIRMRRTKKLTTIAASLTLALASACGCSNKNNQGPTESAGAETFDTISTTAAPNMEEPQTNEQDSKKDDSSSATRADRTSAGTTENEQGTNETARRETTDPAKPIEYEDIDTNGSLTGFLNMMDGVDSMRLTMDLNMNISNAYPGEWSLGGTGGSIKIRTEDQWDMEQMILGGTVYFDLNMDTMKFSDELLSFAVDKNEIQISTTLPDLLAGLLGGSDQLDMMLQQFGGGITFDEIKSISAFSIPVGTGILNPTKVDENARQFALDYLTRILSELDARSVTGSGNDITIEVNGAFAASVMRSLAKNTKDSDYTYFFKYLQENGTPSYNDQELYAAAGRLAEQINKGCEAAGRGLNLTADDLINEFNRYYLEFSDDAGAQLFASESEMEESIRNILGAVNDKYATKENYEAAVEEYEAELQEYFKDGYPKIHIHYDDKAKTADISADFAVTDMATGEKIDLNLAIHLEKAVVSIQKIPNTVEFSEVVRVGYKLVNAMGNLMGPMLSMSDLDISFTN